MNAITLAVRWSFLVVTYVVTYLIAQSFTAKILGISRKKTTV
jgi:hypothetical protein